MEGLYLIKRRGCLWNYLKKDFMPLLKRKISMLCVQDKVTKNTKHAQRAQRDLPDTWLLVNVLCGSLWTLCPKKLREYKAAQSAQRFHLIPMTAHSYLSEWPWDGE